MKNMNKIINKVKGMYRYARYGPQDPKEAFMFYTWGLICLAVVLMYLVPQNVYPIIGICFVSEVVMLALSLKYNVKKPVGDL